MKQLVNILCNLTEYESLEEQLCRINELCEKIGLGWSVDINYSVAKNAIVADVYSEFPEMDNLYEDKSLDEVERILAEKARETEREYRKKVFTEAAEIAAKIDGEKYNVFSTASDERFDYSLFVKVVDKYVYYYHSIKANGWLSHNEDKWTDALTGQSYSSSELFCRRVAIKMNFPKTNTKTVVATTIKRSNN